MLRPVFVYKVKSGHHLSFPAYTQTLLSLQLPQRLGISSSPLISANCGDLVLHFYQQTDSGYGL